MKINIKPLSVNTAWQGKRFKTPAYNGYEKLLLHLLKPIKLPPKPFEIWFEFGFSNQASDVDNPCKPLMDILQKKYKFNDKDVIWLHLHKVIVPKGQEFISFKINEMILP